MPVRKSATRHSRRTILTIIVSTVVGLFLIFAIMMAVSWYSVQQSMITSLSTVAMRETLVNAIEDLTVPAPRDAMSGNYFFPEAQLTLEMNPAMTGLTYGYSTDDGKKHLQIASREMTMAAESQLRNSQNVEQLFTNLPAYQSCSSGILIAENQESDPNLKLAWQRNLSDGRTLYAYTSPKCPAQQDQAEYLRAINFYSFLKD